MYDLEVALESLDSAIKSLYDSNIKHIESTIFAKFNIYETCEQLFAMEGFIDKIKSRFSKNKNNKLKIKNIPSNYNYDSSPVVENTAKVIRALAKTINPFGQYVPLTLSWICTTNIEEINELYKKKNPSFDILDLSSYNQDKIQSKSGFAFLFYDKKEKSIRQAILNRDVEDAELQNLIGRSIKDLCDECLMDTLVRLLRRETYDEYSPAKSLMGYALTGRFEYSVDMQNKSVVLKGIPMDEDYLVGMDMSRGRSEIMWSPNKFTSQQMQDQTIKQLIQYNDL